MFRRSEYVANSYQRYVFFIKMSKHFERQDSLKPFVLLRSKFVLVLMDFSKFDYKNEIARSVMGYVKCCCHLHHRGIWRGRLGLPSREKSSVARFATFSRFGCACLLPAYPVQGPSASAPARTAILDRVPPRP